MTSENAPLTIAVARDGSEWLSFAPRATGWAIFRSEAYGNDGAFLAPSLFIRFGAAGPDEPIFAREVYMAFGDGLGPRAMRDLPLARIEATVNQPAYRGEIFERLPPSNTVMTPFPWKGKADWWFATPTRRRAPRLRMRVPEGRGKPDAFYQQVAERFAYLLTVSKSPANELAVANDVPVERVHGWVKEARRRGLLARGERTARSKS